MPAPDAIVVGSGPNGLAAAITLAQAGLAVHVIEAEPAVGGSVRSAELTLSGFVHDVCSALHPLAYVSPFFRSLPLHRYGLEWVHSGAALANPLADGSAVLLERSAQRTSEQFGPDARRYYELFSPAADALGRVLEKRSLRETLRHAPAILRMARLALKSAEVFITENFSGKRARVLLAGMAGHGMLPLHKAGSAGVALALILTGHVGGWPFPRGGAQKLSDALAAYLRSLGGTIETGHRVRDLRELPRARIVMLDITPRQLLVLAGSLLPYPYTQLLGNYRYGMAAYKVEWALAAPVPWRNPEIRQAATIHLGPSFEQIAASEDATWRGRVPQQPFIIAAQHSLFDPSRAPTDKHTLWAYCHVPNGSHADMLWRMERQIEYFAPGFRDTILARCVMPPRALEAHNANLVGGDILGGAADLWQTLIRPTLRYYGTPLRNAYLCSASTPPGPGVHGMCGHLAARVALARLERGARSLFPTEGRVTRSSQFSVPQMDADER